MRCLRNREEKKVSEDNLKKVPAPVGNLLNSYDTNSLNLTNNPTSPPSTLLHLRRVANNLKKENLGVITTGLRGNHP